MWAHLLIPLLWATGGDPDDVSWELTKECQTGTLIFSQGDCLAVKVFSNSRFTHCAAVVIDEGRPVVYDSMPRYGVRRTELAEYLRLQTPSDIQVVHPAKPLSPDEAQAFRDHLNSELGREYGIKHHITGKRAKGVHCAEYCTDALLAAKEIEVDEPPRVSPGSLFEGLTEHRLYTDGGKFELRVKSLQPVAMEDESWCRRTWRQTYDCTAGCCRQMSRWFLCREK